MSTTISSTFKVYVNSNAFSPGTHQHHPAPWTIKSKSFLDFCSGLLSEPCFYSYPPLVLHPEIRWPIYMSLLSSHPVGLMGLSYLLQGTAASTALFRFLLQPHFLKEASLTIFKIYLTTITLYHLTLLYFSSEPISTIWHKGFQLFKCMLVSPIKI